MGKRSKINLFGISFILIMAVSFILSACQTEPAVVEIGGVADGSGGYANTVTCKLEDGIMTISPTDGETGYFNIDEWLDKVKRPTIKEIVVEEGVHVDNLHGMCENLKALTKADLSGFIIEKADSGTFDTTDMFKGDHSLEDVILMDVSQKQHYAYAGMFVGCGYADHLNVIPCPQEIIQARQDKQEEQKSQTKA